MGDPGLVRLSEHLYQYRDVCNAYVVIRDKRALVIDCGSGQVARSLRSMGVAQVDWLLFTHHHRDQSQGAEALVRKGARVAVPEYERFLFEQAEEYHRHRPIYDSYNDRATANTRLTSLPVAASLEDYETFTWEQLDLQVIPTPGHTLGSVTLLAQIDEQRVAFTGDLLREGGRFHSLHDLEYSYGGCEGADLSAYSALRLLREEPELLCPSHGEVIHDANGGLRGLADNARAWHRWKTGQDLPCLQRPVAISQHLVAFPHGSCTWYALLGDDGRALFIDHGTVDQPHFTACHAHREWWETQRYVEHGIHALQQRWGMTEVAVALPTHYHDDHVAGLWHLQKRHGTEVWCVEQMRGILEQPERYGEMCLFPRPLEVARALKDGGTVKWNGFSLTVRHFPGQTEYHQIIQAEVDGRQVLFTGDSLQRTPDHLSSPVIFRNFHRFGSHLECADKLMRLRPDLVAPGHGEPWVPARGELASLRQHAEQLQTLFRKLVAEDQRWEGINPFSVRIMPYQSSVAPGATGALSVRAVNHGEEKRTLSISLVGPRGVSFEPEVQALALKPGETREAAFTAGVSSRYSGPPRVAIAAEVAVDGVPRGQVAEAYLSIARPSK